MNINVGVAGMEDMFGALRSIFITVRTMDCILRDVSCEIIADGALRRFFRVGGSDGFPPGEHGIFLFHCQDHTRSGRHKGSQFSIKRSLPMYGIKTFCLCPCHF